MIIIISVAIEAPKNNEFMFEIKSINNVNEMQELHGSANTASIRGQKCFTINTVNLHTWAILDL